MKIINYKIEEQDNLITFALEGSEYTVIIVPTDWRIEDAGIEYTIDEMKENFWAPVLVHTPDHRCYNFYLGEELEPGVFEMTQDGSLAKALARPAKGPIKAR